MVQQRGPSMAARARNELELELVEMWLESFREGKYPDRMPAIHRFVRFHLRLRDRILEVDTMGVLQDREVAMLLTRIAPSFGAYLTLEEKAYIMTSPERGRMERRRATAQVNLDREPLVRASRDPPPPSGRAPHTPSPGPRGMGIRGGARDGRR